MTELGTLQNLRLNCCLQFTQNTPTTGGRSKYQGHSKYIKKPFGASSLKKWFPWYLVAIYRFVLAAYCLGWLIYSGYYYRRDGPLWFIWLTNWGYFCVTLYFILALLVTLWYHCKEKHQAVVAMEMREIDEQQMEMENEVPLKWHHKATWVIYNFTANSAILITLLYWALLFPSNGIAADVGLDISTHLLNTIFVILEVILSSIPIHLLHIVYSSCFVIVYMIFTVIYWAAGGTNPINNKPYIYSYINYESYPGLAVGLFFGCLLVGSPICQLVLWGLYKLRQLTALKCGRVN